MRSTTPLITTTLLGLSLLGPTALPAQAAGETAGPLVGFLIGAAVNAAFDSAGFIPGVVTRDRN